MHSEFRRALVAAQPEQPVPCIVLYRNRQGLEKSHAQARSTASHAFKLIPACATRAPASEILALAEDPDVATVWEDLPVHTMLDTSVSRVRAPQLWNLGLEGQGIRIAFVDTGIDPDHPDFEGRIVAIADFTHGGGDGRDGNGHGTHVASIAAGSGEASGGRYIGVAPEAEIVSVRVLDEAGDGMTSDVLAGIEWAVDQGAQVINLSLGSDVSCDGSDALSVFCDAAVAQGVVVCAAAGNAGPRARTVGSPGCARDVITVGATTDRDEITQFSSRGPTADGRTKPDLCFPGNNIVAARARATALGAPLNAFYTSISGTSMATPHASGAAALLLQAQPELTPREVKQRLMATAVDMGLDANTQGRGRADILAASQYDASKPEPEPEPEPEPVPAPGGCLTAGVARVTTQDQVAGGISREVWWIFGALLLLCVCVTCAAGALIAIGLSS